MKPKFNLEDLKRENVFNVPKNYFDRLPNRIMQRITVPEVSEAPGWLPVPLRLALAGSGFAAVFATVFMLNQSPELSQTDFLASVPQTEMVDYILASGQLERTDLTTLNLPDQNLTSEFINADQTEIQQELEDAPIEDLYL